MDTKTTQTKAIATGFLQLNCPDEHTERAYGISRDAAVTFSIERGDNGKPDRVWLENPVNGRREDVPVEEHGPFAEFLVDMVLAVGEDHGRPWLRSTDQAADWSPSQRVATMPQGPAYDL